MYLWPELFSNCGTSSANISSVAPAASTMISSALAIVDNSKLTAVETKYPIFMTFAPWLCRAVSDAHRGLVFGPTARGFVRFHRRYHVVDPSIMFQRTANWSS